MCTPHATTNNLAYTKSDKFDFSFSFLVLFSFFLSFSFCLQVKKNSPVVVEIDAQSATLIVRKKFDEEHAEVRAAQNEKE